MNDDKQPVKKVSIIVSRGSLDGIYPALIMANGARMEGIEASLFLRLEIPYFHQKSTRRGFSRMALCRSR